MLISLPISGRADPASHLYKCMSSVAGETAQMCKPITLAKQFRPQIHYCIVFFCARSCRIRCRNAYSLPAFQPTSCVLISVWINLFHNWKFLGELTSEMPFSHSWEPATKSALVHSRFGGWTSLNCNTQAEKHPDPECQD